MRSRRLLAIAAALALLVLIALVALRGTGDGEPAATAGPAWSTGVRRAEPAGDRAPWPGWLGQRGVVARRIAGRVVFGTHGVAGAEVRVTSLATRAGLLAGRAVTSGADGRFDLGLWPADVVTVSAAAADRSAAIVEVDLRDPLAEPAPDALVLALGACRATLSGTVVDSSGGPLAGALVLRAASAGTTTGADGRYRLCLGPGDNEIVFSADGFGSVLLTVRGRGDVGRDVVLTPEAVVSGRTVRAADGSPVEGALVSAWSRDWRPDRAAEVFARTDGDGRFQLDGLGPGRWVLWAAADGLKGFVEVVAEAGQVAADVRIELAAHAQLHGRVVAAGAGVVGAKVVAVGTPPNRRSAAALSQADGSFVLDEVPLGPVTFEVRPYEVTSPTRYEVTALVQRDIVIEVTAMASIEGRVTRQGAGVPGAAVRAGERRTRSGPGGAYRLDGLAAGDYRALAHDEEGGAFSDPRLLTLVRGERLTGIDLDLKHAGAIEGLVVDQDGQPLSDLVVRWSHATQNDGCEATTGRDGAFRCDALVDGDYRATVRQRGSKQPLPPAGAAFAPAQVAADGPPARARLAVRLDRRTIAGVVVDGAGAAVPDARVRALMADGAPTFYGWVALPTAITDEDGRFAVAGLADGRYALEARTADGGTGVVTDIAAGATGVRIPVVRPGAIEVTLAGFPQPPIVLAQQVGPSPRTHRGVVTGGHVRIGGLAPARYAVTAQAGGHGAMAQVVVAAGEVARITLTSRGQGALDVTIRDVAGDAPVAGMACLVQTSDGDVPGVTDWSPDGAPRTDAAGHVALEPVPSGTVNVFCIHRGDSSYSQARGNAVVPIGGRGTASLRVARLAETNSGADAGLAFDWRYAPPRVESVRAGGPAAVAGMRPGDVVAAVDGVPAEGLSAQAFHHMMRNRSIGDRVSLRVRRAGGEAFIVVLRLDGGGDR